MFLIERGSAGASPSRDNDQRNFFTVSIVEPQSGMKGSSEIPSSEGRRTATGVA